jgi:hypothetical protein
MVFTSKTFLYSANIAISMRSDFVALAAKSRATKTRAAQQPSHVRHLPVCTFAPATTEAVELIFARIKVIREIDHRSLRPNGACGRATQFERSREAAKPRFDSNATGRKMSPWEK